MSRPIVPISQLARRLPELGRLKFGDTNGPGGRRTLDKWRVVSNHEDCLADIASLYGGKPKPYSHPKSDLHFDIHTDSAVLKVGLPTYSGQDIVSLNYEQWSKGGCQRRCNGIKVTTWEKGPDGPEEREQDCLCAAAGERQCDIKLRVSFFLPGVSRFGVWRLDTGSWNAVAEMRGMAELLINLHAKGITEAELALAPRKDAKAGTTRNFVVPEIRLKENHEAIAAGHAAMGAIGAGAASGANGSGGTPTPEIPATVSEGEPPPPDPDDEPIEAEVVEHSEWIATQQAQRVGTVPTTGADWDRWRKERGWTQGEVIRCAAGIAGEAPSSLAKLAEDEALSAKVVAQLAGEPA
jgi:hypothetical protein